jgi:HAD superfamily hydrolase (TIGR01457 family)
MMTCHAERDWKLALIDIDGTLCRGKQVIEGAPQFVERLRNRGIQPVFFTNNATRTPQQVSTFLSSMGFQVSPREVCTSAQAAAYTLSRKVGEDAPVLYIGTDGLREALHAEGLVPVYVDDQRSGPLDDVSAAVVGLDPNVTYQHLAWFCQQVMRLGWWVLTNQDVRLPVEDAFMPGNGAIGSFISTATGMTPIVTGKPEPLFVDYALARYGARRDEAIIIGDNLLTDIKAGVACGVYSIYVETGVRYPKPKSDHGECDASAIIPNETHASVAELFMTHERDPV